MQLACLISLSCSQHLAVQVFESSICCLLHTQLSFGWPIPGVAACLIRSTAVSYFSLLHTRASSCSCLRSPGMLTS